MMYLDKDRWPRRVLLKPSECDAAQLYEVIEDTGNLDKIIIAVRSSEEVVVKKIEMLESYFVFSFE